MAKTLVKLPILSSPTSSLNKGDYDLAGDMLNIDFQSRLSIDFQARLNLGFQARPNVPDLSGTVMIMLHTANFNVLLCMELV